MEVGADVWYKCKNEGWVPATIIHKNDTTGQIRFTVQKNKTKEEFLVIANKDADVDSLKLMNNAEDSEVENLINLPFLHEPAILYCLELRYYRSQIYTYTGPILIAVNPFKRVDLYTDQLLAKYYNSGLFKAQGMSEVGPPLPPHPYAIADNAYRLMMGAMQSSYGSSSSAVTDQSILISGESGAGKTESTKIVLRYLTTVASETLQFHAHEGTVMDKVLKSNPILEALGNAKTIRNDNSSRFGKFIELNFDKRGHLIGGFIRTYLLEKIRLTAQQANERCFHIFYQVGKGGSAEDKTRWDISSMNDFHFANQGNSVNVERLDDKADYNDMRVALDTLRFLPEEQRAMLDIIAGILHLGQIKFNPDKDGEGSELSKDTNSTKSLNCTMRLLGLTEKDFVKTVTERTIVARNEKYQKKLTANQASDARDSIARIIYGKLFDWVVATINKEIKSADPAAIRAEIGVLDIFGFECLKENSFEQLCINYTNETLQQQFNQFVFKMEQEEYTSEGIEWSFVSFPDNQDCIDLIDLKKKSIFSTLDDECMLAGGTDEKFASRMIKELGEYDRFSVSAHQKTAGQFSINHYAGEVVYNTQTFVDKNKDELPKEAMDVMSHSTLPLLQYIFSAANLPVAITDDSPMVTNKKDTGRSTLSSPTICTQFKAQLGSLMKKIQATKPHYIRCIKPNDLNKPDNLNRIRTTEQLRYGGVLEAVRVARSGFPVRLSHEDFFSRYRPIANPFNQIVAKLPRVIPSSGYSKAETIKSCTALLESMWDDSTPKLTGSEKTFIKMKRKISKVEFWRGKGGNVPTNSIQLGKTKVFFRKQAHDLFEGRRSRAIIVAARSIQAGIRGFMARAWFRKALKSISRLQIAIRYFLFHRRFIKKRRLHAALKMQTAFRCHLHSQRFSRFKSALVSVQKCYRGSVARRLVQELLRIKYATKLQALMKRLRARYRYRCYVRAIIALQCRLRVKISKRILREEKIAARDVGNLRQSNEQLKLEIEKLRAAAAQETSRAKLAQHVEQEAKLKETFAKAEDELASLRAELEEERKTRREVERKLAASEAMVLAEIRQRTQLEDALSEREEDQKVFAAEKRSLEEQLSLLQKQIRDVKSVSGNVREVIKEVIIETPSKASADSSTSRAGISEEKLAEILSGYVPVNEHERKIKALKEEAEILRKTISGNAVAQQELIKQIQRRKSVLIVEPSETGYARNDRLPTPRGAIKEKSELHVTIEPSTANAPVSPAKNAPAEVGLTDLKHIQRPTLEKRASSKEYNLASALEPKDAELIRQMSLTREPVSPEKRRPQSLRFMKSKSVNAEQFMKNLKTHEGIALLKQEMDMTRESKTPEADPSADLGFRPSPHPDHQVPQKKGIQPAEEAPTTPQQLDEQAKLHRKTFDQNLETFKTRLVEGFRVIVYSPGSPPTECSLQLEKPALLQFTPPPRGFSLFARKPSYIPPISVYDMNEISSGLSKDAMRTFTELSSNDNNTFITLIFSVRNSTSSDEYSSKFIVVKLFDSVDRNALLSGLRSLMNEVQLKMNTTPAASVGNTPLSKASFSPATPGSAANHNEDVNELRANYEMLMVQLFILSNDLNEREEEIIKLREREETLLQHMLSKEKMYEQDAIVRMQLGKRLEQVLMDKEEIKDELEQCKMQLEQISMLTSGKVTLTPQNSTSTPTK